MSRDVTGKRRPPDAGRKRRSHADATTPHAHCQKYEIYPEVVYAINFFIWIFNNFRSAKGTVATGFVSDILPAKKIDSFDDLVEATGGHSAERLAKKKALRAAEREAAAAKAWFLFLCYLYLFFI